MALVLFWYGLGGVSFVLMVLRLYYVCTVLVQCWYDGGIVLILSRCMGLVWF